MCSNKKKNVKNITIHYQQQETLKAAKKRSVVEWIKRLLLKRYILVGFLVESNQRL